MKKPPQVSSKIFSFKWRAEKEVKIERSSFVNYSGVRYLTFPLLASSNLGRDQHFMKLVNISIKATKLDRIPVIIVLHKTSYLVGAKKNVFRDEEADFPGDDRLVLCG